MTFTNILFLFYFLPIILILYFLAPRKHRNTALFIGSLVFCAWGEPVYFLLLFFVMILTFLAGRNILKNEDNKKRKIIYSLTVILNLICFVFFSTAHKFIGFINSVPTIGFLFVALRLISFITDVYRNEISSKLNFINFGTYIIMFPQMVVGTACGYAEFENQLTSRIGSIEGFSKGLIRFIVGFSKKVLIADVLYALWTSISEIPYPELSVASAWLGIVSFGFSIYFSLSGYSDMAIGLGKMFGFDFCENFSYPYTSRSVSEFWNRWFISLTSWLKKYVYAPLKTKLNVTINTFVIFILIGIIHGIDLNFILWGIYFAVILTAERILASKTTGKPPKIIGSLYTLFFVLIGWVLFSNNSFFDAFNYFKVMFGFSGNARVSSEFLYDISSNAITLTLAAVASLPFGAKKGREYIEKNPMHAIVPVCILFTLCLAYVIV